MAIRTQQTTTPAVTWPKNLRRLLFSDDGIVAVWEFADPGGRGMQVRAIDVTPALAANITARAAYQNLVDAITTDTQDRATP